MLPIQHNVNMISFLLRMKRILLIIAAAFCLLPSAQARGIVGKWYCSKAFFDSLGVLRYPKLKGYFKFEDDGTFEVKINGELQTSRPGGYYGTMRVNDSPEWMQSSPSYQTLLVKVRGKYSVNNSTITTKVDPNDVYVDVDTDRDYPDEPGTWASRAEISWKNRERWSFESSESRAMTHENTIKREKIGVWNWDAVPITVAGDSLQVGGTFCFYRSRRKAASSLKRRQEYESVNFMSLISARKAILKRTSSKRKTRWALRTLRQAVEEDKSASAMEALGLAYIGGIGVECDTAKAVALLEEAGRLGVKDAYHALGMIYKYGEGGLRQDFRRAYGYFCTGAERGSVRCIYAKGFMLYKGLGCRQDYQQAALTFLPAANSRDENSWYMLALCSRNGYGLEKDSAAAAFCLKRAARMGSRDARDELARPHEETYMHAVYADSAEYSFIPDSLPAVKPTVGGAALAEGHYSGFVVTYDWSGKYILGEQPFAMTVSSVGGELSGELSIDSVDTAYCGSLSGGRLVFASGGVTLPERYERGGKMDYRLDSMVLDVADGKVTGRLNLYSTKLKEPGRPMYFELRRRLAN